MSLGFACRASARVAVGMTALLIAMNAVMAMFALAALGIGAFGALRLTGLPPGNEGRAEWRGPTWAGRALSGAPRRSPPRRTAAPGTAASNGTARRRCAVTGRATAATRARTAPHRARSP